MRLFDPASDPATRGGFGTQGIYSAINPSHGVSILVVREEASVTLVEEGRKRRP